MRLRITFAKTTEMRFTSHLDLHRTWERTLRRAQLPLAYSQGFNPHPRINLASALPLGFTGEAEIVDVWLEQAFSPDSILAALQRAAPPGIEIRYVEPIDERIPALQTELEASEYLITLLKPQPGIHQRVEELLAASQLPRSRRGKEYDLRPLVLDLQIISGEAENFFPGSSSDETNEKTTLYARLAAREGATGRPEEVIAALGSDPNAARVHRIRLLFASQPDQQQPEPATSDSG